MLNQMTTNGPSVGLMQLQMNYAVAASLGINRGIQRETDIHRPVPPEKIKLSKQPRKARDRRRSFTEVTTFKPSPNVSTQKEAKSSSDELEGLDELFKLLVNKIRLKRELLDIKKGNGKDMKEDDNDENQKKKKKKKIGRKAFVLDSDSSEIRAEVNWLYLHGLGPSHEETRRQLRQMRTWFNFLDIDHSGGVGVDELKDPLISVGLATTQQDVEEMVKMVNSSGTGEISFDEFFSIFKQRNGNALGKKSNKALHEKDTKEHSKSIMQQERAKARAGMLELFERITKKGQFGHSELDFPILITAYRRHMLLSSIMADKTSEDYKKGCAVKQALLRDRALKQHQGSHRVFERHLTSKTSLNLMQKNRRKSIKGPLLRRKRFSQLHNKNKLLPLLPILQ